MATLPTVIVNASGDASAQGLSPAYPGGQVARGGRAGILGTKDNLETPFSITSYTNELIQDRQAKSVGDVLQNDPTVRTARGFGNFQEAYFIRGFILASDDVAYNGLYSLLPRQYIATELFERVEVLRGASAFLTGATPGNGGIGGVVNLLPKRAPNEPLTRVTAGLGTGGQGNVAVDIARRLGPTRPPACASMPPIATATPLSTTSTRELGLLSLGLDWRSRNVRLSGDIGWQDNKLERTRPSVSLFGVAHVPDAPDADKNFAQPWSYSNEKDLFGTLRGEVDITDSVTAWGAYGWRRSDEKNSLSGITVSDADIGAASTEECLRLRRLPADQPVRPDLLPTARLRPQRLPRQRPVRPGAHRPHAPDQRRCRRHALDGRRQAARHAGPALPGLSRRELRLHHRHPGRSVRQEPHQACGRHRQQGHPADLGLRQLVEGLVQGPTAGGNPPPVNNGEMLAPMVSKQKEIGLKYDGASALIGDGGYDAVSWAGLGVPVLVAARHVWRR